MIIKLMGIADLVAATIIILLHYSLGLSWKLPLIFAAYLVLKGVMFWGNISSFLDMLCGAYILAMVFGFSSFMSFLVAIYLFQKAVFSIV